MIVEGHVEGDLRDAGEACRELRLRYIHIYIYIYIYICIYALSLLL